METHDNAGINSIVSEQEQKIKEHLDIYRPVSFNLIPIEKSSKKPAISWIEFQKRKSLPAECDEWFLKQGYNIGVVCGAISANLMVIDVDDSQLLTVIFPKFEELKKSTLISKTPNGFHLFFRTEKPFKHYDFLRQGSTKPLIEIRAEGNLAVLPPSKTNEGEYLIISEYLGVLTIPETQEELQDRIRLALTKHGISLKDSKVYDPEQLLDLKLKADEGRNNILLILATWCRKSKLTIEQAIEKLRIWNEKQIDPLPESEFLATVNSAYKPDEPYNFKFKKAKKNQEVEKTKRKAFLIDGDKIYLEIYTRKGEYKFAHLEGGAVQLLDKIDLHGNEIFPQVLPIGGDGKVLEVVKMPDEGLANCEVLPAEQLFQRVMWHFKKYLDLIDLNLKSCTYYTFFTWFYRKVNTLPYLRFLADTGKGKSRMLKVVGDLCFYPISVAGASSFSGAMRTKERWHGTMVIDESDFKGEKESQIIKYLNLGFEAGKYFCLSDKQDPKRQDWFDPFCPKVIAMRIPFNDNATEGRLLSIPCYETTNDEIPIILPEEYEAETIQLRNLIARFVLGNWARVDGNKMLSFKKPHFEARLQQLAMPFSIIFQIWPDGENEFKRYLTERQKEIRRIRAISWEGQLFNFVFGVAQKDDEVADEFEFLYDKNKRIQAVTPSLVAKYFKTTTKNATNTLNSIGFNVERWCVSYLVEGEFKKRVIRGYVIPSDKVWKEVTGRYYCSEEAGVEDCNCPEIPEILKSKKFTVCGNVSNVSQVSTPQENLTDLTNLTDAKTRNSDSSVISHQKTEETEDSEGNLQDTSKEVHLDRRQKVQHILSLLDQKVSDKNDLVWHCAEKGISQEEMENIIEELTVKGIVYESNPHQFLLVNPQNDSVSK